MADMLSDEYSEISSEDSNSPEVKAIRKALCQGVSRLFGSDLFSDLTIVVGEKEIKAHKFCLTYGSPVFKAMLETDCKESNQSIIHINDFDYDVVMQMLEYLYTSKASKIDEMADRLLMIAEKYNIEILKAKCQKVLIPKICVNNVLQIIVLAERNGATKLEEAALSFLKVHYKDVRETDAWNNMRHDMRQNHSEIYEKMLDFSYGYASPKKIKRN